jgi:hypothetical protein
VQETITASPAWIFMNRWLSVTKSIASGCRTAERHKAVEKYYLEPVGNGAGLRPRGSAGHAEWRPPMLVWRDHIINNQQVFHDAIRVAGSMQADHLVTLVSYRNKPMAISSAAKRWKEDIYYQVALLWLTGACAPIASANTTGTAACLCSGRKTSPSWQNSARISEACRRGQFADSGSDLSYSA